MSAVDIKYMPTATRYDIIDFIYNHFHKYGWKTTYNYIVHQPQRFCEKPLLLPKGSQFEFTKYINYCYLLTKNFTDKDEVARYTTRNGTSIYFSVVLYWLLVYFGVLDQNKLKYCQGYFSYRTKEDDRRESRYRAGMHAWLSYSDSVLDVTIGQQKDLFDFAEGEPEKTIIIGEMPTELDLYGFEENKSLAKEYARQFARDSGMTFYEWISFHKQQADSLKIK
ncbi:MAG TPA: hypothetical protein VNT57_03800 [Desulfobacteria bacterium]|nr:hypothetical protein [Desulfobacteria bacterium]